MPNSCLDLLALASLRLRITCFFAVEIANSQFFSLPNYKFGRTGIPDVETLQKKILEELKKDDVRKIINAKFKDKKLRLKENLEEIFDGNKIESADDLYKILDDENQFEKIFKLEEIK